MHLDTIFNIANEKTVILYENITENSSKLFK